MSSFKTAVFYLISLLSGFLSFAQTDGFARYTTKDGLLSDEVYNLHQDKLGYIWVFTNYGALKYNSVEFKPVLKNLPFSESFIYSIYENEKNEKWVANSNAKIYKIINDSAFIVKGTEKVSEQLRKSVNEIYQLYVDDSLNIYTISKQYSYKFIKKKESYVAANLSLEIKKDSVVFMVLEKGKILLPVYNYKGIESKHLFARNGKIGVLLQKQNKSEFYELNRGDVRGTPKIFKKFGKDVYFTFYNRLGKITDNNQVSYTTLGSYIINFTKDKYGHTWLGCLNNGIYELDEHDSIVHHYLGNTTINDILIDSQNEIWASSPGQGLFNYKNLNTFYFKENDPLASSISFIKKIEDKLFIANTKGDVFLLKNNTFNFICKFTENSKNADKAGRPLDIIKTGSNYLISFVFSIKELMILNDHRSKTISIKEIRNAFKIKTLEKDSLLYMHRRGFGFIVKNKFTKRVDVDFKTYDFVYRKKTLFVATDNGVRIYKKHFPKDPPPGLSEIPIQKDSLAQPDFLAPTKNSLIKKITKDWDDNLWFSSIGSGLFLLDSLNNLSQFSVTNGLPSNIVNNITFTDSSVLLCTNKGLFFSQRVNSPKLFNWTRIYSGDVENSIVFEGKIYLSTTSGLVVMDYSRIDQMESINFNLSSIYINSLEQNVSALKRMDYTKNNIEFRFDVIHFTPDKIEINYLLSGPIIDSGVVASSNIVFQNLPPGNYSLEAFPSIPNGKKNKIIIPFNIKPAFWQTLSFFIISVLFLTLVSILIAGLIFRSIRKKRDKKEQAERLILEYKLIALKAQINPHFMSNCLSAIQLLIINNKVDAATNYIAKFGLLVRQILNFSTRSLVSVNEELEIAILNMELEQLRFENKFEYEIVLDPKIDKRAIFVPALILNPIIENAIWHGLLPLKNVKKGKLILTISMHSNILVITIEDNGVGRQINKQNLGNSRQSKGIQLTEQRLSNINYLYNLETAKIIYNDLFDDELNSKGTRVMIELPLNLIPLKYE